MYTSSLFRRRRGLTLIELIVVMVILAALAGILIPSLSGLTTRAHTSSSATNVGEVAKALQTHEAQFLGYPDRLDSLVTDLSGGTMATTIAAGGSDLAPLTLDADTLAALNSAGIVNVTQMVESAGGATSGAYAWSPTFFPYAAPSAPATTPATSALATGNIVLGLAGPAAAREFGASGGASYALFGIGRYSTMNRVMLEAPVHFEEDPARSPNLAYARYVGVFQVTDNAGNPLERARLVGVAAIHNDQISGIGAHLSEYWNANKS